MAFVRGFSGAAPVASQKRLTQIGRLRPDAGEECRAASKHVSDCRRNRHVSASPILEAQHWGLDSIGIPAMLLETEIHGTHRQSRLKRSLTG